MSFSLLKRHMRTRRDAEPVSYQGPLIPHVRHHLRKGVWETGFLSNGGLNKVHTSMRQLCIIPQGGKTHLNARVAVAESRCSRIGFSIDKNDFFL